MDSNNPFSDITLFPFSFRNIFYCLSGRNALWHIIKILRLAPDDEVLAPSYNCGAEIDPAVKAGLKVKLYGVDSQLRIDTNDLKRKISRDTKAVLVTHYFGFPQAVDSIREICDDNGLYLIEDCSHAMFSTFKNKHLGSFGDISFYSILKFFPVPDGGILVINNGALKFPDRLKQPPLMYELKNLARKMILGVTGINNKALLLTHRFFTELFQGTQFPADSLSGVTLKIPSRWYEYRIDLKKVDWSISRLSLLLLNKFADNDYVKYMIGKRRKNFNFMLEKLEKSTTAVAVFKNLPEGVCPSLFPVFVKERDRTHELLFREGIFCFKTWPVFYPGMSWDQFPDAVFLKKHIISLPIRPETGKKHMIRAVNLLNS